MIKWSKDNDTINIENEIAVRAVHMAKERGIEYSLQDAMMDIDACHCNGNPLRLTDLRNADSFNFAHDVFGIHYNLDRTTGKLQNCFVPRYSIR